MNKYWFANKFYLLVLLTLFSRQGKTQSTHLTVVPPVGHQFGINDAAFSDDGSMLVTTSTVGPAKLWDTKTGRLLLNVNNGDDNILNARIFANGRKMLIISAKPKFLGFVNYYGRILDLKSKKYVKELTFKEYAEVEKIFVSKDDLSIMVYYSNRVNYNGIIYSSQTDSVSPSIVFNIDGINIIDVNVSKQYISLVDSNNRRLDYNYDYEGRANLVLSLKVYRDSCVSFETNSINVSEAYGVGDKKLSKDSIKYCKFNDKMIYSIDKNGTLTIYDKFKNKEYKFQSKIEYDAKVVYDKSFKYLFVRNSGINGSTFLIDCEKHVQLSNIANYTLFSFTSSFSDDGRLLVIGGFDGHVKCYDISKVKPIVNISVSNSPIINTKISSNNKYLFSSEINGLGSILKMYDLGTNKLLWQMEDSDNINYSEFSGSELKILIGSNNYDNNLNKRSHYKVLKVLTGELLDNLNDVSFLGDKPSFYINDELIRVELMSQGRVLSNSIGDFKEYVYGCMDCIKNGDVDKQNNIAITISKINEIRTWDLSTGSLISKFKLPSYFEVVEFNLRARKLLAELNGQFIIYDLATGEKIIKVLNLSNNEFLFLNDENYYYSSKKSADKINFVDNKLQLYNTNQIDVKYNRPDKVLVSAGCRDTQLVKAYYYAYLKRLDRLGLDTNTYSQYSSIPVCEITNRNSILLGDSVKIEIKSHDSIGIEKFNLWINECPIFGMKGLLLKHRNIKDFDTTIWVHLSYGSNQIDVSILNYNNIESYKIPLLVESPQIAKPKIKVYFVGIGIDKFKDTSLNLKYCSKDIRDLANKFNSKYANQIIIDTLLNSNVTVEKVKLLKGKLIKSNINDIVIIAFSGHGFLSKTFDYYLSTYEVNDSMPEINGLPYGEFEKLVDNIPARKKLILIDACHSGELDSMSMESIYRKIGESNNIKGKNTDKKPVIGLDNSFELMQDLFVNSQKGTGATIISACSGIEFARENDNIENGLFTQCIIDIMDLKQSIKLSTLKLEISDKVKQRSNGTQVPTFRNEPPNIDWLVW